MKTDTYFWLGQEAFENVSSSPLSRQEGGDHYRKWPIQPVEFAMENKLDLCQANVVKYVCRFRDKGGIEDLLKAKHYIDLLILYEYGEVEYDRDGSGIGQAETACSQTEPYGEGFKNSEVQKKSCCGQTVTSNNEGYVT